MKLPKLVPQNDSCAHCKGSGLVLVARACPCRPLIGPSSVLPPHVVTAARAIVRTAIALGERHRKEDGPGPHAPAYDAEDVMNAISLELSDELFERAIHEVYVNAYARRKRND